MRNKWIKTSKSGQTFWASFTFAVLLLLVVIQVLWIIKAARLEEQNFNHKVGRALREVKDELRKRASDCNQMRDYLCGRICPAFVQERKIQEVDSIIRANLEANAIELDYKFLIGDSATLKNPEVSNHKCYVQSLNGFIQKDGIRLSMRFPDRNQFIFAQLKGWFLISIAFIVFVAISFFISMRMFYRERAQLVHTTDFINNMVHEFQTPLANMRLAAGLIRKKNDLPAGQKINEYLDVIVDENQKMEQNVRRILQFSTLGQPAASHKRVNIHQLITQILDQFSFRTHNNNVKIETHFNATDCELYGAEDHFLLLMSNIIDNSLKYTGADQPKLTITTTSSPNHFTLTFSDNGIGIDKNSLPYIFEKYYRVPTGDIHNVKGFGLGLAYVKKITDLYKGTIKVESTPGIGTTFTLKFPLSNV